MGIKEMIVQPGKIGLIFQGNKISKIIPNSQAEQAGLRVGWAILKVNGISQPNDHQVIVQSILKAQELGGLPVLTFDQVLEKSIEFISNQKIGISCNGNQICNVA